MKVSLTVFRNIALVMLMIGTLTYTLIAGRDIGADARFPGPMVRHRDSAAIAITYLHYDRWFGYASYTKINKRLNDLGMSLEGEVWKKYGGGMLDLMQRPETMDAALAGALQVTDPAAEGLYFIDSDEKGMSLFYIFCFALFGYKIAGFFYGYLVLLTASTVLYCFAFFRRADLLFVGLAVLAAHFAAVLVCQQLEPDVNVIHSSRFIGLVTMLASLHLSLLVATRERLSFGTLLPALGQVMLLSLVIIARNSALWELFPVFMITGFLWAIRLRKFDQWPAFWPSGLAVLSIVAIMAHNAFVLNPHYRGPGATQQHVFWHALALGLHNNPNRLKYGIPASVDPSEDTVAHIIFQQEITRRGQTWADFETKNSDRTLLNGIDLAWGAYELVLRDVLLRTMRENPLYVLQSFLIYQPLSIAASLFSPILFDWPRILDWRVVAMLAGGLLVAAPGMWRFGRAGSLALGATLLASLTPVILVAPSTNRVLEVYVVIVASSLVMMAVLAGKAWPARLRSSA